MKRVSMKENDSHRRFSRSLVRPIVDQFSASTRRATSRKKKIIAKEELRGERESTLSCARYQRLSICSSRLLSTGGMWKRFGEDERR